MVAASDSFVLYVDYAGHLAPLSRCFHATASRRLSSLSEEHPPTTTTNIDSAFCPQCLSFQDAASAASNPFCKSCQQCPLCQSVASVVVDENQTFYKCGYCSWTSKECNLVVPVDAQVVGKEELLKAKEELLTLLQTRKLDSEASNHYETMLKALEGMAKDEIKRSKNAMNYKALNTKKIDGPWSVQSLEESIQTRQEKKPATIVGNQPLIFIDTEQALDESLADCATPTTLLLQSSATTGSRSQLLPLPMPLRPRLSRRCRAELKEGRPGILVKPKLNPLEGDSSLRSGHGQWWKKDSSAIQVVPRLTIVKKAETSMLVKVTNPTLGVVNLRLGASSLLASESANVVVDSLSGLTLDIVIVAPNPIEPTSIATLQPVEDNFLDMNVAKVPDAVMSFASTGTTRLVTSQADVAWFEVAGGLGAVPISLQVQVGDGSWESSLIRKQTDGDEPDFCNFDVVLVTK